MRLLFIAICCFAALSLGAQDIIVTQRDTLPVKITKITADSIYFLLYIGGEKASSHGRLDQIVRYQFEIIEQLRAEDSIRSYTLVTPDKEEINGDLVKVWHDSIAFKTQYLGVLNIRAENILRMIPTEYTLSSKGQLWFPNPNETRYYFGPTAYNLKKGEGYYQNSYVLLNMFNYGITDYFSIGGGFEFVSTFTGYPTLFLTPKVGFPITPKWSAGAGIMAGIAGGEVWAGIGYGIVTYGNHEHNASLGLGYGVADGETTQRPVITFSGMTRIGRKVSLVSENWFAYVDGRYNGIVSYGIRLFGPKMSFDIALLNNGEIASEIIVGVPYIDFVIKL